MKIAYIGDHRGRANDDEGAITYALEWLGHRVVRIQEGSSYDLAKSCDFALIHHHWKDLYLLEDLTVPKVFWFFDLIHHPDLPNRLTDHVKMLTNSSELGFCTDGFWPERKKKAYHLSQGADPRIVGCQPTGLAKKYPILFAGSVVHQIGRRKQCEELARVYQKKFVRWTHRGQWVYRKAFAKAVSKSKIVLSLKAPTKDNYWSNRVFVVAGFGGFQLHPYCSQLADYYKDGEEIVFYHSQEDLEDKINYYLGQDELRVKIGARALERTVKEHTYTHRCRQLIDIVQERLG